MEIQKELFSLQDKEYMKFLSKLTPNVSEDTIIGVRIPEIRKLAKKLVKNNEYEDFLKKLPHKYHDENLLHGAIISESKDFENCIKLLDNFLPFIDNWAVCDVLSPNVLKNNREETLRKVDLWLKSERVYTVRFAIGVLMQYFLDKEFNDKYLEKVARIENDDYYVKMMQAWYFATAVAKQPTSTLPLIESQTLIPFVQNKTIQKARESRRISPELKKALLAWKITEKGKG